PPTPPYPPLPPPPALFEPPQTPRRRALPPFEPVPPIRGASGRFAPSPFPPRGGVVGAGARGGCGGAGPARVVAPGGRFDGGLRDLDTADRTPRIVADR